MVKKKKINPLSRPLAISSMSVLVATGIPASFDNLRWLFEYLLWGWVACFGLLVIWALIALRIGVITSMGNLGRLDLVYRSKEPKTFFFLSGFYLVFGSMGFVSLFFILVTRN